MFNMRKLRFGTRRTKVVANVLVLIAILLILGAAFSSKTFGLPPEIIGVNDDATDKSNNNAADQMLPGNDEDEIKQLTEERIKADKLVEINKNEYNDPTGERLKMAKDYYQKIFKIFRKGEPKCKIVQRKSSAGAETVGVESIDNSPVLTKEYLASFIDLSKDQRKELTKSHELMVKSLPDSYPEGLYKGNGIVYVGGGAFNWYALLSIQHLRRLGCTLPIEVIIPEIDEYETDLCQRLFPTYGAHCIFLPKVLDNDVRSDFLFKGYQYKSLALLVSSFENVLMLDADNIPTTNPEIIFKAEPFNSTGLVVWPDFWKRTTSPDFYSIAGIKLNEKSRTSKGYARYGKYEKPNCPEGKVLLHQLKGAIPDPSSESGQLLISKKEHTKDILMALYYNLYGPNYFYPLFSQGAAGEGDKETFIAGAHVLNRPYYQVRQLVSPIGMYKNGKFRGVAMRQADPMADYQLGIKYKDSVEPVKEEPKMMFMHVNFPKLDPIKLKVEEFVFDAETKKRNRFFGDDFARKLGYDFELAQYQNMKIFACDPDVQFEYFRKKNISQKELCDEVMSQLEYLESTTDVAE
ncbi:hypothetical protein FOA43_000136 [Brettanomyces nanus]|uniref:Uncharacterized protein n=1 Tax=Eeniella nana TaxID=13502 RepID=A0A875S049_EENNA|nr:uncharacterized protein FOA43_000136 [Brettanomyces nanus]QPG72834.1 hypothetical protein FOA43_000136 [Brettanomyces nanus]